MNLMPPIDRNSSDRFKGMVLFLCMMLPVLIGCGALNSISLPTATPTASIPPTSTLTQTPEPTFTPTATAIPTLCGGPPAMFILLVGSDSRKDSYDAGLADSIRLVRLDFIEPRVQLLSFYRDLYVEIPGIEDHGGVTHGKLNQAYLYGNPAYDFYDDPGQGPGLLALTLEHNFGAHVDHYVALNLQSFVSVVDAFDGIDINLPFVIDGRVPGSKDANLYFPAGKQHLNGYRTMLLARLRQQGDFQRAEIQNLIMLALAEKLFSLSIIRELPQLLEAFRDSVQTDLGLVEIGQLLCLSTMLDLQKIEFVSFPEDLFKSERVQDLVLGNTSILAADFDILKTYVQNFNNGVWVRFVEDLRDEVNP